MVLVGKNTLGLLVVVVAGGPARRPAARRFGRCGGGAVCGGGERQAGERRQAPLGNERVCPIGRSWAWTDGEALPLLATKTNPCTPLPVLLCKRVLKATPSVFPLDVDVATKTSLNSLLPGFFVMYAFANSSCPDSNWG